MLKKLALLAAITTACACGKKKDDAPASQTETVEDASAAAPIPSARHDAQPADSVEPTASTLVPGRLATLFDPETDIGKTFVWKRPEGEATIRAAWKVDAADGTAIITVEQNDETVHRFEAVMNGAYGPEGKLAVDGNRLVIAARDSGGSGDPGSEYRYLLQFKDGAPVVVERWEGTGTDQVPAWGVAF